MIEVLEGWVEILEVAAAIVGAMLAYRIYKFNRIGRAWLAVVIGMLIIATSSLIDSTEEFLKFTNTPEYELGEDILLLIGRMSVAFGLWGMVKSFESFDVVEKKAREKAKLFSEGFVKGMKEGK